MKLAVAYKNGMIYEHFGHCECFAIYEFKGFDTDNIKTSYLDTSDKHGHVAMANLMKDEGVDVVICGNMGKEAKDMLLSYDIFPITGNMGSADMAAELFVSGRLPMQDGGSCSGSCSSCGCEGEDGCGSGCH